MKFRFKLDHNQAFWQFEPNLLNFGPKLHRAVTKSIFCLYVITKELLVLTIVGFLLYAGIVLAAVTILIYHFVPQY